MSHSPYSSGKFTAVQPLPPFPALRGFLVLRMRLTAPGILTRLERCDETYMPFLLVHPDWHALIYN